MKKIIALVLVSIIILTAGIVRLRINSFQSDGSISLQGLKSPVKVIRDEKGVPYIRAENLEDAFMAQGFVTAQDRLFQMEFMRLAATGRLSELAGKRTRDLDIHMRTLGFYRNGKKHAQSISDDDRILLQSYSSGINQYISQMAGEHHLEFRLAGIKPGIWGAEDIIALYYFMGWQSASNFRGKIVAYLLAEKLGAAKAGEIFPASTNPDDDPALKPAARQELKRGTRPDNKKKAGMDAGSGGLEGLLSILKFYSGGDGIGSNNWAVSSGLSSTGKPIFANDTHQDSSSLPGIWHPVGIIIPGQRAVGAVIQGLPGVQSGRNSTMAFGMTNSYNDAQDLYVETADPKNPANYLEGEKSIPFEVITEVLRIRDKNAMDGFLEEKFTILLTRRGPVISGTMPELSAKKIITLRWSPFETMDPQSFQLRNQFMAGTVDEFKNYLTKVTFIMLNLVFADERGNIGWHTTGRIPVRSQGNSLLPYTVKDSRDNWQGWIPFDKMPHEYNPAKGWLGTANHKTVKGDYPYYLSSHFAPYHRYARLKELISSKDKISPDDCWEFQRDAKNLMAKKIAPLLADILISYKGSEERGAILRNWDYIDSMEDAAPALFQSIMRKFVYLTYEDELGSDLTAAMLDVQHFWKERFEKMVLAGDSKWFDNVMTQPKESMNGIVHRAVILAVKDDGKKYGSDPAKWKWGDMHRIDFINPVGREGLLKKLLGAGSRPVPGSGETLNSGTYNFSSPYTSRVFASLRMVADLADRDKVAFVIPGGASGRAFDSHNSDQIKSYLNGDKLYLWLSDEMIIKHTEHTLILKPEQR